MGNEELSEFLNRIRKKSCIRKSFGPAIGMEYNDVDDCSTALNNWKSEAQLSQMPPVPCAHCVEHMNLSLDEDLGLWLTNESLERLNSPYLNEVFDDFSFGDEEEEMYGFPIGKAKFNEENIARIETNSVPRNAEEIVSYDQMGSVINLEFTISEQELTVSSEEKGYGVILSKLGEIFYLRLVTKGVYRDTEC